MLESKLLVVLVNGLLDGLNDVENVKGSSFSSSSTSFADSSLDAFVVKNGLLVGLDDVVKVKGFETSCSSSALLEISELLAVEGLENCLLVGLKPEDVNASSPLSSSNSFVDSEAVEALVVKNGLLVALDDVENVRGFESSCSSSNVSNLLEVSELLAVDGLENCLRVGLDDDEDTNGSSTFSSSKSIADSTLEALVVKNGLLVALDDVVNVNGFETSCSSSKLLDVSELLAVEGLLNCLRVGLMDDDAFVTKLEAIGNREVC